MRCIGSRRQHAAIRLPPHRLHANAIQKPRPRAASGNTPHARQSAAPVRAGLVAAGLCGMRNTPISKQMKRECRHFTGMGDKACEVGIAYDSVSDTTLAFPDHLPCLSPDQRHRCSHFAAYTDAECQAHEAAHNAVMNEIATFERRETENCLACHRHVDRLEQVGRCVYARPCGCRQWQGYVPEVWQV